MVAIDEDGHIDDGSSEGDQDLVNVYGISSCGFAAGAGCMSNGDIWTATISYNGTTLSMTLWDTTGEGSPFTVYSSQALNIAPFLGTANAYVGFTGGTGAGFEQQDILNWELSNTATLTGTPEPATLGLVFAGIAGIALVKRRRSVQR
jgi:Na+/glutamate symporter